MDSTQRIGCTHLATNTRLRVISSNAKSAMGILGVGLVVLDEPGAFDIVGGEMMADALFSGQGKPNSPLKLLIIGTLAPNQVQAGSWYYDLVAAGTKGSVYVQKLQGDPDTWDTWATIRKANPLTAISPQFRHKLLEERDAALGDTRLSARFKSYRLNLPTADESSVLLEVDDYKLLIGRDVPERDGSPIVGVDLGSNRAFSAAVATWANGRTEALAVCPGIPSVAEQERRDKVPRGTYQRLVDDGSLDSGGRSARTARWPSVEHHDRILGMAGAGGLRQVQVTRTPGRCRGRTNRDPQGIVVRSIGGHTGLSQAGQGRPLEPGRVSPGIACYQLGAFQGSGRHQWEHSHGEEGTQEREPRRCGFRVDVDLRGLCAVSAGGGGGTYGAGGGWVNCRICQCFLLEHEGPDCAGCVVSPAPVRMTSAGAATVRESKPKPPPEPPMPQQTPEEIRAEVLTELAELAKPAADRFWRKYVPLQDVAKILRIGWQEMSGHRKRLDIPATRLTAPDGEGNMMLTVEDARRLIADIVAVD